MSNKTAAFSKNERFLLFAVTVGSILEWHEVFLFVYWAPLISSLSLHIALPLVSFINTLLVFVTAWIARPLGGVLFGYIGDRWGRKGAFVFTIFLVSLPSIATWFVASFYTWSIFTLVFFGFMKFLQGVPAGGETPGAICYLVENSLPRRRIYISSFTFVGSQIGQLTSMVECLLLKKYLSLEDLLSWGWQLSFLIGGMLGIGGFFLRRQLQESHAFQRIKKLDHVALDPVKKCFQLHWRKILICLGLSAFEVSGFYLLTVFPFEHFEHIFAISENQNIGINLYFISISTLFIPVMGYLGSFSNRRKLLLISLVGITLLSYPFYFSVSQAQIGWTLLWGSCLSVLFCIIFAFLPSILAELFPTQVRFTGIGFSFNVCDSLVVGAAPLLTHALAHLQGGAALFILAIPLLALLFLFSFRSFERQSY